MLSSPLRFCPIGLLSLFLVAALLLAGCDGAGTDPPASSPEAAPATTGHAPGVDGAMRNGASSFGTPFYGCFTSIRMPDGPDVWRCAQIPLAFPEHILDAADGRTRSFSYRLYTEGDGQLWRLANCTIPHDDAAEALMEDRVATYEPPGTNTTTAEEPVVAIQSGDGMCGTAGEPSCELEPVIVTAEAPGPPPLADYDWPSPPGDWPVENEPGPRPFPNYPEGPGGSGPCEDCQPEEPADPCDTGNEVVDDPDVQETFSTLWNSSDYGTEDSPNPLTERRERGAWIVDTGNGYETVFFNAGFWTSTPCGLDGPAGASISDIPVPDGAVGYVHTHPFARGENTSSVCNGGEDIYAGGPSRDDVKLMRNLANEGMLPFDAKGFVIDAGGISQFNVLSDQTGDTTPYERCGY